MTLRRRGDGRWRAAVRTLAPGLLVLVLCQSVAADAAPRAEPGIEQAAITEIPVSFDVLNTNRSAVPCASDGLPYTVTGHLVGPRSELTGGGDRPRVITVLLTGLDEGEWTWRFQAVPG